MALFTISDLHLSFSSNKPMDIFKGWDDHASRIERNWKRIVGEGDTVVLPGDFSWSMKLEDSLEDFRFLESLPGRKLLLKGNHDLWWCTLTRMKRFLSDNGIGSVDFVHNNAYAVGTCAVCGSRGWFDDGEEISEKLLRREALRLKCSIDAAIATGLKPVLFTHYPPFFNGKPCSEIFEVIKQSGIDRVYHGHIHGSGLTRQCYDGVTACLVSCDCIDFTPVLITNE